MSKYYAGIGSRQTPIILRHKINKIALRLQELGFVLRSGGAIGADTFFDELISIPNKEIFVPEIPALIKNSFKTLEIQNCFYTPAEYAFELAAYFHPAWGKCNDYIKKLHARNVHQILGKDLQTKSDFVICWTEGGKQSGGTAQAMRIAQYYEIPIFNLYNYKEAINNLGKFLNTEP